MLDGLELFGMGFSWGRLREPGDPIRLRPLPHRHAVGPGGPGLRFQVGLEDLDDLTRDLEAGFARLRAAS